MAATRKKIRRTSTTPSGFIYRADFICPQEEDELLAEIRRLRLARKEEYEIVSVELERRSACIFQGEARWKWQHSIPPVAQPRTPLHFGHCGQGLRYSQGYRSATQVLGRLRTLALVHPQRIALRTDSGATHPGDRFVLFRD